MSNDKESHRLTPNARREQILEVASAHFAREGDEPVSIQAIAEDAGVTRALVYHYFPGRDALLKAVFQREADRLAAATEPLPGLTPRQNIERALNAYIDQFTASSGLLRDLFAPRGATAALVHELGCQQRQQRLTHKLAVLGLADTPAHRAAMLGWMAFATEVARGVVEGDVARADALRLSLSVLASLAGEEALDAVVEGAPAGAPLCGGPLPNDAPVHAQALAGVPRPMEGPAPSPDPSAPPDPAPRD